MSKFGRTEKGEIRRKNILVSSVNNNNNIVNNNAHISQEKKKQKWRQPIVGFAQTVPTRPLKTEKINK